MKKMLCILAAAALFLSVSAVFAGCSGGREERNVYCISARYGDGVLSAQMDFTYFNGTGENTDVLEFNLFGNAYREDSAYRPVSAAFAAGAYYDGESWGGMEIVSVSPCASWEISGADENILSVRLAESVAPGKSAVLEICWTLTLAKADHRTGIARRAVNLGNFYPVLCVFEEGGYYECEY